MPIQRRNVIGVDIGSSAVKLVAGAGPRNWKAGQAFLPDGVMSGNQINSVKLLSNAIKMAQKAGKISNGKAVLCLSGPDVIIRPAVLPRMNPEQLKQNVIDEITSYLAVDPAMYVIDYKVQEVLTEGAAVQYKIMIVAVPKNVVKPYITALKQAGLSIVAVDVAANAKEKLVRQLTEKGGNIVVIDLGMNSSVIDTYLNGRFYVSKINSTGLNTASMMLSKALQTDPLKALEMILSQDTDPACAQAINDYVDQVMADATRVIDYFRSRNQKAPIDHVFVCGGGVRIPGVLQMIQERVNMPVEDIGTLLASPFKATPESHLLLSAYATAAGATLTEVD